MNSLTRLFPVFLLPAMVVGMAAIDSPRSATAQDGLLKHFPKTANALTLIDVDGLLQTDLAKNEAWGDKSDPRHAARPVDLPTVAKRVAIAAQLNTDDDLARIWELAVMDLRKPIPLQTIALREGGYIDDLSGIPAVWTPSDTYFVAMGSNLLGAMYPASRQFASRWARQSQGNQLVELNDYLSLAAARLQPGTQIVMALDLKDVVQPHNIREALSGMELLAGKEAEINTLSDAMLGLQGITLTVQVTDKAQGTIRIDFANDVTPFGNLAKPLFLEALQKFDAVLPDLDDWDAELLGQTVVLSGELSMSGLRRLGSLLEPPSTKFSELEGAEPAPQESDSFALASQQYFRGVHALIDDLRKTLADTRDNHALWMERYGRKIDALPILNVDPELLAWGASVAETFRSMSVTERSANVRSGIRKSSVTTSGGYGGYGGYGYGQGGWYGGGGNDATASAKQRSQITRSEQGTARIQRFGSWKEVEDSAASIRIAMTQKYHVEF